MEKYLINYKHDIYPVSLFLILNQCDQDNIEVVNNNYFDNEIKKYMAVIDNKIKASRKSNDCKMFCKQVLHEMVNYLDIDMWEYYVDIVIRELNDDII